MPQNKRKLDLGIYQHVSLSKRAKVAHNIGMYDFTRLKAFVAYHEDYQFKTSKPAILSNKQLAALDNLKLPWEVESSSDGLDPTSILTCQFSFWWRCYMKVLMTLYSLCGKSPILSDQLRG